MNTPISVLGLAIGCGIFVQGVAAYSFAPIFSAGLCFETPSAESMRCKFWANSPFTIRVCPGAGELPKHVCV